MAKLIYFYSNGITKVHNDFITDRAMEREGKDASRVEIWKVSELDIDCIFDDIENAHNKRAGKYITTIGLK